MVSGRRWGTRSLPQRPAKSRISRPTDGTGNASTRSLDLVRLAEIRHAGARSHQPADQQFELNRQAECGNAVDSLHHHRRRTRLIVISRCPSAKSTG